jgi:hypothetical protein
MFHRDPLTGAWRITHFGYVGGVGPGSQNGTIKFWLYDPADLLRGINVSKSWGEPTLSNVINFVINGVDDRGIDVGLTKRSIFESPVRTRILGRDDIPKVKRIDVRESVSPQQLGEEDGVETTIDRLSGWLENAQDAAEDIQQSEPVQRVSREDIKVFPGLNIDLSPLGTQKTFQVNRNNMADHLDWFTSLIDARWWFEPTVSGPLFVIDATSYKPGDGQGTYQRRQFIDEALFDDSLFDTPLGLTGQTYVSPFMSVNTLNNNALADIKPFNTLELYGETSTYRERYGGSPESEETDRDSSTDQDFSSSGSPGAYTEQYPYVKLQYKPLLQRAGGYPYSVQPIESDEIYLDEAREAAIDNFRQHLADQTEGEIELEGEPHALPYDYVTTLPVCNDTFQGANTLPITWEINGVRHKTRPNERYVTELGTSITFDESQLDITATYRRG